MSKRISRGLADLGGVEFEPVGLVQDCKVAIEALFTRILDGGYARTKKTSTSPGGLTDDPYAPRIEPKQEVGCSGRRQLARKVDAGHEMHRHGDLLVHSNAAHKVSAPTYRFELGKRACA